MLVLWNILKPLLNTLTTDDKYSVLNRKNLTQSIQVLLSRKQRLFLDFSPHFLNLH